MENFYEYWEPIIVIGVIYVIMFNFNEKIIWERQFM